MGMPCPSRIPPVTLYRTPQQLRPFRRYDRSAGKGCKGNREGGFQGKAERERESWGGGQSSGCFHYKNGGRRCQEPVSARGAIVYAISPALTDSRRILANRKVFTKCYAGG